MGRLVVGGFGVILRLSEAELQTVLAEFRKAGIEVSEPEVQEPWWHYTLSEGTSRCEFAVGRAIYTQGKGDQLKVALFPLAPVGSTRLERHNVVYERARAIVEPYAARSEERIRRERLGWLS